MIRPTTIVLLVAFLIYAVIAFFVRHNQALLLMVGILFGVTSGVLRNFILVKKDNLGRINITAEDTKITVDDSRITIEDTKKPRDSAKTSK